MTFRKFPIASKIALFSINLVFLFLLLLLFCITYIIEKYFKGVL